MKKVILLTIMMLLLVSVASAESCFTALNVPTNEKMYWKAVTYESILDNHLTDYGWLLTDEDVSLAEGLGAGYQFQMRIDDDCFQGRLLSSIEATGIKSSDIVVQDKGADYFTSNPAQNKIYTISRQSDDTESVKQVGDITTGLVDGVDYLALPDSFDLPGRHQSFYEKKALCDDSNLITEQLEILKYDIWKSLVRVEEPISCNEQNIIDCVLEQGKGEDIHYATLLAAEAKQCGIPTRVVKGISEGSFNGVDISFDKSRITYWIEFYDNGWKNYAIAESGPGVPISKEQHCGDNLDNDGDGAIDCWDSECDDSVVCEGWPSTDFYGTDLFTLNNPFNVPYLELVNDFGGVIYNQSVDLRNVDVDQSIVIGLNSLKVSNPAFEMGAKAHLTSLTAAEPLSIMKNSVPCADCELLGYANQTAIFTIPGTGVYTIEGYVSNETTNQTTVPSASNDGLLDQAGGVLGKVKAFWNKLTTVGKLGIPILILLIYLLYKRRQKNKWKRKFKSRG